MTYGLFNGTTGIGQIVNDMTAVHVDLSTAQPAVWRGSAAEAFVQTLHEAISRTDRTLELASSTLRSLHEAQDSAAAEFLGR